MPLVAANLYYWGRREQSLFLRRHIAPWYDDQHRAGAVRWLWFDRFDARGPHLLLVVGLSDTAGAGTERALREHLEEAVRRDPSPVTLTPEALEQGHRECRGKALCTLDREPGMAANNTVAQVAYPAQGRPVGWSRGLRSPEEFLHRSGTLVRRCIDQLPDGGTAAALRWVATLDRALTNLSLPQASSSEVSPAAYWRFHLSTLLMGFGELPVVEQERLLDRTPALLGARNRSTFERVWGASPEIHREPPLPSPQPLLEDLLATPEPRNRWPILRDLIHTTLKQLAMPVAQHVPLVLFALHRHRCLEASAGP